MYNFKEQLGIGEEHEKELDNFFGQLFNIRSVSLEQQTKDFIDRKFSYRKDISVEYKADLKAHETGNAFIETISSDKDFSEGWAIKSKAEWLIYYIPNNKTAYLVEMSKLREKLPFFCTYKKAMGKNQTYSSHGRLVPLAELEKISRKKYHITNEYGVRF